MHITMEYRRCFISGWMIVVLGRKLIDWKHSAGLSVAVSLDMGFFNPFFLCHNLLHLQTVSVQLFICTTRN